MKADLSTSLSSVESTSITPNDRPKLDLDTLHAAAVQEEMKRARSPVEKQQEENRRNKSLEARIERGASEATHTDCRTAYAQTGLLAPLFIASDLLRDKGCHF